MIHELLKRLWPRTFGGELDPVSQRLELALLKAREETSELANDGADLAARIRRNAISGRGAFTGKQP